MASSFNYFNNHYVIDVKSIYTKKSMHGSNDFCLQGKENQIVRKGKAEDPMDWVM